MTSNKLSTFSMKTRPKYCTCVKAPPPRHFIPHTAVTSGSSSGSTFRGLDLGHLVSFHSIKNSTRQATKSSHFDIPKKGTVRLYYIFLTSFSFFLIHFFSHCFFFYYTFDKSGLKKVVYAKHIDSEHSSQTRDTVITPPYFRAPKGIVYFRC